MRRTFPRFGARKAVVVFASTAPQDGATLPHCQPLGVNLPRDPGKRSATKELVSAWIESRMAELHIETPAQLARRLGNLDRRMVGRWVDGKTLPSGLHMPALAKLFGPPPGLD